MVGCSSNRVQGSFLSGLFNRGNFIVASSTAVVVVLPAVSLYEISYSKHSSPCTGNIQRRRLRQNVRATNFLVLLPVTHLTLKL
mmetsp:Transcript_38956/g.92257  ORF Transcript_38956/g.92257 Transcript_38956/m.92257 type:complete len:84 (-) Transcript_38956:890-1141(-)